MNDKGAAILPGFTPKKKSAAQGPPSGLTGSSPLAGTLTLRELAGRRNRENLDFEEVLDLMKR
jgi:hypothetical protein